MQEKSPLQSKKFVAFLVAEFTWKALAIITVTMGIKEAKIDLWIAVILLAICIIAGFVESGFIIGQASLDKYVRVAKIAADAGKNFNLKGVSVTSGDTPSKPDTSVE